MKGYAMPQVLHGGTAVTKAVLKVERRMTAMA